MAFTTLIDAPMLQKILGKPRLVLLDCRFDLVNPDAGRAAYAAGHIPSARYADLNRDLAGPITAQSGRHPLPNPQVLAATLQGFGIGDDTQVIAYDEGNSAFAARAWWLLRWLGHPLVAVLDGGLKAWVAAGGSLETGAPPMTGAATTGCRFNANVNERCVIGTAEVVTALQDPTYLLIDARAAERYQGAVEPIDAVAGHIPGAVNHPFTNNLAENGCFLPAAELKSRWTQRLGTRKADAVWASCGSGVTACHNLLSLEVAGLPGAKLYAGSWSEWIRDPKRPVARGA